MGKTVRCGHLTVRRLSQWQQRNYRPLTHECLNCGQKVRRPARSK